MLPFQEEGAGGITPQEDKHEMCFEYVDVAEGQFTIQEYELQSENVDTLSIKEEVPTKQNSEMLPENITAPSVKKEPSFAQEPRECFENAASSGRKEYEMCFKIIDVTSIKEEPCDVENVTEDPFATQESESLDVHSIKIEQGIVHELHGTCFTNITHIKEGEVENVSVTAEQSTREENVTFVENVNATCIKEEQYEIQENESCIQLPIKEDQFATQDTRMCFMDVDHNSVSEEHLTDECLFTTVQIKDEEKEEVMLPEERDTETNEVFRLVHC